MDVPTGALPEGARLPVRVMAAARARWHSGEDDGVRDPIGQPLASHQEVGDATSEALLRALARIAALAESEGDDSAGA